MRATATRPVTRFNSVFISDVHLGARECRADLLLEFLRSIDTRELVLVGDIIDLWSLRRTAFWPKDHSEVVRVILDKAKSGTRVIYVPGNHDEEFRELASTTFRNVEIHRQYVHQTAAGRRLLVLHGDEFDGLVKCSPWLSWFGNVTYDVTLGLNRHFNGLRRAFGYPYWSLAGYLKQKSRNAVAYIERFEQAATAAARRHDVDGIVCGHIHRAALEEREGVVYCNDGDWVESCTAIVETLQGELALTSWAEVCGTNRNVVRWPLEQAA